MRSFLYWIDTDRKVTMDADAPFLRNPMGQRSTGPVEGKTGLLVYTSSLPSGLCKYSPADQEWIEAEPGRWVGYWRNLKPTPGDLIVDDTKLLDGWPAELGDGNVWILPRLKSETEQSGLPHVVRLSSSGCLYTEPVEKYKDLCKDGERLWETLLWMRKGGEKPERPMVEPDIFRLISRLVGVNYRVGPAEVSLLGLVTTHNFLLTAFSIVGIDLLEQAEAEAQRPPGE